VGLQETSVRVISTTAIVPGDILSAVVGVTEVTNAVVVTYVYVTQDDR
jgi:hypothetical protein